jgi:hypothetical protein
MQLRRAFCLRSAHINNRGQRRIVDGDALGAVHRLPARLGNHRGDRLADVAHDIARQRKARRLGHGFAVARLNDPQRPHGPDAVGGHVVSAEHRDDARTSARRGCIDRANLRVPMEGAHENAMQGTGSIDVGHEAATAEQKAAILEAAKRRTDALMIAGYCSSSRTKL